MSKEPCDYSTAFDFKMRLQRQQVTVLSTNGPLARYIGILLVVIMVKIKTKPSAVFIMVPIKNNKEHTNNHGTNQKKQRAR